MANWPSTLPEWPYVEDSPRDVYIYSSTDVGPGKSRRRYTGQGRAVSFSMNITGEQRATLDNFYVNNITFIHADPKNDTQATFRFEAAPQYRMLAGANNPNERVWNVQLSLMRMP